MNDSIVSEVPKPRIIGPCESVDLTGKSTIEFKWYSYLRATEAAGGYFDLRLFEPDQTYSWQIRQVKYDLRKSDWSYETFRVIKR